MMFFFRRWDRDSFSGGYLDILFEGDCSKNSFQLHGMFVSPSNQPRGEYHLPKFFKFLSWILSVLPKGDGDVFRKVIRNKDSVSPSPKLTVNVPENRPAFPQKERQTSFKGISEVYVYISIYLCIQYLHIFIYTWRKLWESHGWSLGSVGIVSRPHGFQVLLPWALVI